MTEILRIYIMFILLQRWLEPCVAPEEGYIIPDKI